MTTTSGHDSTARQSGRTHLKDYARRAGLDDAALESVWDWLAEGLIADEFPQLGEGGHTKVRTPLRKVFVDLPITDRAVGPGRGETPTRFLQELSTLQPCALSELLLDEQEISNLSMLTGPQRLWPDRDLLGRGDRDLRRRAGTLLIGGPGQGKSTLGQLACQLHRAALVQTRSVSTSQVQSVLRPFQAFSSEDDAALALPNEPMLPLRVVLPRAATWLADPQHRQMSGAVPALLRFLAAQPGARKARISAETLSALAEHMPFLLVLDGFDEIGAVEDRQRVVVSIRELLEFMAAQDAAAVIVATTRPQGYAGEMARIGVHLATRYLALLDVDQALAYADKLVQAQIEAEATRVKTMERLREAARASATQYLLRTPLQVTILAALVRHHRVPRERWNLFWRYFDLIYRREIEHETYASSLLAEHRVHIEEIHRRVALLLQVEAESAGGADALMARERLRGIVDAVLAEDEISDEERTELTRCIIEAAERRLVFLVEPEPGRFGFEIRSVQEFMAAWALTQGRDAAVEDRLVKVAKAPLFENVVLFMTSRFYSEGSTLRDVLAERICADLNEDPSDALARTTRAGSLLALAVLEEGASARQPKRARALIERAVGLLDLPPNEEHYRLARVATDDTVGVLRVALEKRVGDTGERAPVQSLAAWACLMEAAELGQKFAHKLADTRWPSSLDGSRALLRVYNVEDEYGAWLISKIASAPHLFEPSDALYLVQKDHRESVARASWIDALPRIQQLLKWDDSYVAIPQGDERQPWALLATMPSPPPHWLAWLEAVKFNHEPSTNQLAAVLRMTAESQTPRSWHKLMSWASWPVSAVLRVAEDQNDLLRLADLARSGALGHVADWYRAQEAWRSRTLLADTVEVPADGLPWNLDSLTERLPLTVLQTRIMTSKMRRQMGGVLERASVGFEASRSPALRRHLAELCLVLPGVDDSIERNQEWLSATGRVQASFPDALRRLTQDAVSVNEIREAIELVVREPGLSGMWYEVFSAITTNNETDHVKATLLLSAFQAFEAAAANGDIRLTYSRAHAIDMMRALLRKTRRSGLAAPGIWNRLGLPLPYPAAPAANSDHAALPELPVVLSAMTVRRVRGIHALDLAFEPPDSDRGQWIVFLGPNGAGKTTLLRSLVLGLRDLSDPRIWPNGTFATPYMTHGTGDRESLITFEVAGRGKRTTRIRDNGKESFAQAPPHERPALVPVFAYGCRRGSALGGAAREVNLEDDGGPEVATIFDEGAPLIHAESWLIRWDGDALKNPASQAIYDAVRQALCQLLDIRDIAVRDQRVWITQRQGPDVLLAALSDGYLTSAGWFIDLVARWIALARKHDVKVAASFLERMTGLVLLDEIDLHLHPGWQIEVIGRTRALLPRMSFVVTTHNPLTLVGARPEEIWQLSLDDGRVVAERGQDTPMLLTGGQIYSRYFGIRHLYPHALGRKLERYTFLAGSPLRSDDEQAEMVALREELATHGIELGWDEVPRAPTPSAPAEQ